MSICVSQRIIELDEVTIAYEWLQKPVRNLNLRIRSDGTVTVSSPEAVELKEVEDFLRKRKVFLLNALKKSVATRKGSMHGKQFVNGESFTLLGKALRLKLVQDVRPHVTSDGVYLYVYSPDVSDSIINGGLIEKYMEQKREQVYHEILENLYPSFRNYGISMPELRIEPMPKRWGSCSASRGIIRLHNQLVEMPRPCVEYVVMHELCHLVYPDHSKEFYTLLTVKMPDWKQRQKMLDMYSESLT